MNIALCPSCGRPTDECCTGDGCQAAIPPPGPDREIELGLVFECPAWLKRLARKLALSPGPP